jgi:hypothetical protein
MILNYDQFPRSVFEKVFTLILFHCNDIIMGYIALLCHNILHTSLFDSNDHDTSER